MTNHEYWSCRRKRRYSMKDAERLLKRRVLEKGRGGCIYQCDYCTGWHISKKAFVWPSDTKPKA